MQKASLSHCFVGLGSAFYALSANAFSDSFPSFIFLDISSAVFSADFFVPANIKACFPIFRVSSAMLRTALSDFSSIFRDVIRKEKEKVVYKDCQDESE